MAYHGMVYLSHPFGGNEDNREDSIKIEAGLNAIADDGYTLINPLNDEAFARAAEEFGCNEDMILAYCEGYVSGCALVIFCNGWENSRGCRVEHRVAVENNIPRIYLDAETTEILRSLAPRFRMEAAA